MHSGRLPPLPFKHQPYSIDCGPVFYSRLFFRMSLSPLSPPHLLPLASLPLPLSSPYQVSATYLHFLTLLTSVPQPPTYHSALYSHIIKQHYRICNYVNDVHGELHLLINPGASEVSWSYLNEMNDGEVSPCPTVWCFFLLCDSSSHLAAINLKLIELCCII